MGATRSHVNTMFRLSPERLFFPAMKVLIISVYNSYIGTKKFSSMSMDKSYDRLIHIQ